MKTVEAVDDVREVIREFRRSKSGDVGFVPTMGYLHEGHISLVEAARRECGLVVMSIFVNPLQFGPQEDLATYPRDLPRDESLAERAGVDLLFTPTVQTMYPPGASITVKVGAMAEVGEGRYRPGHFDGVATVCAKLFNIVNPARAYFGEKDAQQLAVIRKMVSDLDMDLEIVGCPTVREADGLAMSSRNVYLDPEVRAAAPVLYRALTKAQEAVGSGETSSVVVRRLVEDEVRSEPLLELQYVETFDEESFLPVESVEAPVVLALAAFAGKTRLIDNVRLVPPA